MFIFSVLPAPAAPIARCGKRVLAYYPDWVSDYKSDKIPYSLLSHICHAFMIPGIDGSISGPTLEPALITNAHANNVKVLVSVGGATVDTSIFSSLMSDSDDRGQLIDNLYNFCAINGYDGVDIDWEYPANNTDMVNLNYFMEELREKFDESPDPAPSWEIAMAVNGSEWSGKYYDYNTLNNYVDFYNLMTYDMHGPWSNHSGHNSPVYTGNDPYDSLSCESYMDYMLVTKGVPAGKINMGIPFYGYLFTTVENLFDSCGGSCPATQSAYKDIIPLIGNGWTYNWDATSLVPYLTYDPGVRIIVYDNASSISKKVNYALATRNAGGVFMWEITQDYTAGTQPLMDAMYNAVDSYCDNLKPKMPWLFLLLSNNDQITAFPDHYR